jgi:serine protease Do
LGLQASLTVGVVSATGRNNLDIARIEDFIQTDAAINRGNSGGPLLDLNGNVVGINTAIASNMGGYMGIGFAIPSNMANHVMHELIDNGSVSRGYLGVTLQAVDQDLAKAFGLDAVTGALIADVRKESPAEKSGIRQGDIVMSYNGTKVANVASLRNAVALMKPGTQVSLTVLRDGKQMQVPVAIAPFPASTELAGQVESKYGFEVENVTPKIAKNLGLIGDKGVVVSKVRPGSPAAWAGIQKGALVLEVNKKAIETVEEFNKALEAASAEQPILLLIKQDDQKRFISFKVG